MRSCGARGTEQCFRLMHRQPIAPSGWRAPLQMATCQFSQPGPGAALMRFAPPFEGRNSLAVTLEKGRKANSSLCSPATILKTDRKADSRRRGRHNDSRTTASRAARACPHSIQVGLNATTGWPAPQPLPLRRPCCMHVKMPALPALG